MSVEWRYSATGYNWNSANLIYSYLSPGKNGTSAGHLLGRSNHTHEAEQIKLFIYDLQDTDGGHYFCQIFGGNTLRDNVTFQPISKSVTCYFHQQLDIKSELFGAAEHKINR